MKIWIFVLMLGMLGCNSAPESPEQSVVEQPTPAKPATTPDVGTSPADAASPDALSAAEETARPETKTLERRDDVAEFADGTRVVFLRSSHKHRVGGGTVGIWGFRFEKQGEEPLEFEITDERLHAEGEAFGRIYVLKWNDGVVDVTWMKSTPQKLDREQAVALARAKIDELALESLSSKNATVMTRGVLEYIGFTSENAPIVRVWVGLYTREVDARVDRDAEPVRRMGSPRPKIP